jgi:hypothetical protein
MDRSTRIAEVMAVADQVNRMARSIRAVITNEDNEFKEALDRIRYISENYNIPAVVGGALAVIKHGYRRTTEDIDILLNERDIDEFIELAKEEGFYEDPDHAKGNWPHLVWGPRGSLNVVGIDIIPSGALANKKAPTKIPTPEEFGVSEGLSFICLHGLMEMKLSSNRGKDLVDVIELIKRAKDQEIGVCENHLRRVHPDYLKKFVELIIQAKEEREQEMERGGLS